MELLSFIILQPGLFCTAWFVQYAVQMRRPLCYSLLSVAVLDVFWILNNLILDVPVLFINAMGYPICYLLLPLLFAKPSKRVRALAVQMLLATLPFLISMVMDFLLRTFIAPFGLEISVFYDPRSVNYLILSLVLNLINCFAMYGTVKLLGRMLSPVQEGKGLVWFLMIPFSQLILITMLTNLYFYKDDPVNAPILTGLAVLLCVGSDIACLFGFRKYKRMQQTGRHLAEVQHQLDLQAEHYLNLQADILRINEIRHDLKNQLQSALYLIKQGNAKEADSQLELLHQELCRKVGTRYCENPMVDAVLTEKARACEENNVRLLISAPLPQQVPIENAYLCSAFSNLLDNALDAVLHSDHPDGPIDFSCDVQGAYLTISCKNPGNMPKEKKNTQLLRVHGLGLDILKEIARKYDGSFRTEWNDGIFKANLTLKL